MEPAPTARKTGSAMSDKEMARAAVEGREVVFFPSDRLTVAGFIVGMDDFHWKVACPRFSTSYETYTTQVIALVHKSCPVVQIGSSSSLLKVAEEGELDWVDWVKEVGTPFWAYCERTYFGKTTTHKE